MCFWQKSLKSDVSLLPIRSALELRFSKFEEPPWGYALLSSFMSWAENEKILQLVSVKSVSPALRSNFQTGAPQICPLLSVVRSGTRGSAGEDRREETGGFPAESWGVNWSQGASDRSTKYYIKSTGPRTGLGLESKHLSKWGKVEGRTGPRS